MFDLTCYVLPYFITISPHKGERERLWSFGGVIIILLIGFLCSAHPGHVKWRSVLWGVGLEFLFGFLVLRWEVSKSKPQLYV